MADSEGALCCSFPQSLCSLGDRDGPHTPARHDATPRYVLFSFEVHRNAKVERCG